MAAASNSLGLVLGVVLATRMPRRLSLRRLEHFLCVALLLWQLRKFQRAGLKGSLRMLLSLLATGGSMIPGISGVIEKELQKELDQIKVQMHGDGDADANTKIPKTGMTGNEVIEKQQALLNKTTEGFQTGQKWAGIYYRDKELSRVHSESWTMHSSTNTLYPGVFPSVRKYEAEVVSMILSLVHGHEAGACGLLASGGTESILIAMLSYRNQARERGIVEPEILAAITAHPALYKACTYFGLRLTKLPVDENFRLRAETVRGAISGNTVAIYASAPTFTHGVVDPIVELGELAQEKKLGLHVDNCLGGFLLSYLSREGLFAKAWDFAVPGVTTMSVDVHKYGFATKGASVVIFRTAAMRSATYVPSSDGCEGLYVTPTLQGARSGANIAVAWASIMHLGDDGYTAATRRIHGAFERIQREVESLAELQLITRPDAAIVPMQAKPGSSLNIYQLAYLLEQRGWNMFTGQLPPVMSMCIGEQTTDKVIDRWVSDVKECLEYIRTHPEDKKIGGTAAVYGAASTTPPHLLHKIMKGYVDISLEVMPAKAGA